MDPIEVIVMRLAPLFDGKIDVHHRDNAIYLTENSGLLGMIGTLWNRIPIIPPVNVIAAFKESRSFRVDVYREQAYAHIKDIVSENEYLRGYLVQRWHKSSNVVEQFGYG
ncbi:MAG: hypothetical protein KKG59_06780 [Nanoarchaeota archaeon]|nr:hypothetical protein [Nanoarchaeota archaeon]